MANRSRHDLSEVSANKSICRWSDSTSTREILSAYEEKLEFKDDKEPTLNNISVTGLKQFARKADQNSVMQAVDLVAFRTLGFHTENKDFKEQESVKSLFKSVKDLIEEGVDYLHTGCPLFDQVLNGGLRCGVITEISGESGAGKSQVCLHLASIAAIQHIPVIYLQTEATFPISRLKQILSSRCESSEDIEESMNRIYIMKIHNYTHMLSLLDNHIQPLIQEKEVKLLIVDSITALVRGDKDIENISERTEILNNLGNMIKVLSTKHQLATLLVNQVSSVINYPGYTFGRKVIPCLGPYWSSFINTRLFIAKTELAVYKKQIPGLEADTILRSLEVDFSSYLEENFFNFIVTTCGIMDINIAD